MEKGSDHPKTEEEVSYNPAETEVEQQVHGNVEREHEQLIDMQKMQRAITHMAEQQTKFYESQVMAQAKQVVQQEEKKGSVYEKFIKLLPPVENTTQPSEAEGGLEG